MRPSLLSWKLVFKTCAALADSLPGTVSEVVSREESEVEDKSPAKIIANHIRL